jgi:hypothetical protein
MTHSGDSPPRKGPRWLAERIAGSADAPAGGETPARQRLSRSEIDDLVSRTLEEELERLEEEEPP